MTVKELIKALEQLDQDAVVEIADSYNRRLAGYSEIERQNASSEIFRVYSYGGHYIIEDYDSYL